MTKAVHENSIKDESPISITSYLKDEYGAISDHLCNHVHLTNCIHLKNHMHRGSPNFSFAERSLLRDLISLQKSRSLRDPSTSPASWFSSPYIVGSFAMEGSKDGGSTSGRRSSTGVGRRRESGRLFKSSTLAGSVATAKVAAEEAASDYYIEERERNAEVAKGGETGRNQKSDKLAGSRVSMKANPKDLTPNVQFLYPKILSEHLAEELYQTGHFRKKDSGFIQTGKDENVGRINHGLEGSTHGHFRRSNRGRKFRLKGTRRPRGSIDLVSVGAHHNQTVKLNSIAKGSNNCKGCQEDAAEDKMIEVGHPIANSSNNCKGCQEDVAEDKMLEAGLAQRNVCGIPCNWSRLHHRGKTFLHVAGRSLSCGLSDSGTKQEGPVSQVEGNIANLAAVSDQFASSASSEVLSLLIDGQESHGSGANCSLSRDYSGELEIFSDHYLGGHDGVSDLECEARSVRQRSRQHDYGRHRSLTQKYMPKTFKDLVGQNLVVQALCNSISRRKVGQIYVFYGLHGTGKTSCARVFAKALNCLSMEHPKPCDACSSCISSNLGRSRDVLEVGPLRNLDFQSISDINNLTLSSRSSLCRVFILDDCDSLPSKLWSVISKVIDQAPRHVIFILICSNLERMPHGVISRCQKFFFPKIRDADIISTLRWIATSEGLEIDKDALKLIASHSDGSLRDAEMTLDQLSLLGKKISLPLVQELVGLVSDEKLVDLLELALSADTVNTVKNLREIIETGVDPIALMSQLATLVTDVLAGSYVFTQEGLRRKFFHQPTLSKEEMERLRQALKKLSEAEKQLRDSNDKLTWLTAALLQLAPEHQYTLHTSATGRSLNRNSVIMREMHRDSPKKQGEIEFVNKSYAGVDQGYINDKNVQDGSAEKIWLSALEYIESDMLRQFLCHEGSLVSVNLGAAPAVQLMFNSNTSKSRAEGFRGHILQAFESVLQSPVILEIISKSMNNVISDGHDASVLSGSESASSKMARKQQAVKKQKSIYLGPEDLTGNLEDNVLGKIGSSQVRFLRGGPHVMTEDEIIETIPHEHEVTNKALELKDKAESAREEASTSQHDANLVPLSEKENGKDRRKCLVRSKVSLAHVIQQAEGCSSRGGWSRRKAMSIAEKLEQENRKLEPQSRRVFCWKAFRRHRAKPLKKLRIRATKRRSLSNLVACGRCLHTRSPR